MKTKLWLISLLIVVLTVVACGPAADTNQPTENTNTSDGEGALEIDPAPDTMPVTQPPLPEATADEAYPPQPAPQPTAEGYPAAPAVVPTVDPYPEAVDGFIWMLLPVGVQCEDDSGQYSDLQDAVAGLTAVNVLTSQSEIAELNVCAACGCPTSAHFRVQVSVDDVNAAQSLGWVREQ